MGLFDLIKKPRKVLLALDIVVMVISVIFMICNFVVISQSNNNFALLDDARKIWKQHLLMYPFQNNETLKNVIYENPIFCQFPDSMVGYYCWDDVKEVKSGEVPRKTREDFCFEMIPTKNNIINSWKHFGSSNFTFLQFDYTTLIEDGYVKKTEKCDNNDTLIDCGIVDSLNQHLCLPSDIKCPILDMKILSINSSEEEKEPYKNYNAINSSDSKYTFYYANASIVQNSSKHLTSHFIIDNEYPCSDPTKMEGDIYQHILFTTYNRYKKNECPEKSKYYSAFDENYYSGDLFKEYQLSFLVYLGIPSTLKDKWDNLNLTLYTRNYPGIDIKKYSAVKKTLQNYDSDNLIAKMEESEYRFYLVSFFFIVCLISTFLLVVFKSSQKCYYLIRTVRFSQDAFIVIFTILSMIIHRSFDIDDDAFDKQLSENLSQLKKSIKAQSILSIVEFIIGAIFILIDWISIKLTEKVEEQYKRIGVVNSEFYN